MQEFATYLAIGLGIGMVSGTMGIGGGVLMVPVLMFFCHFTFRQVRGTSLAVLVMPVVLPAAWKYFQDLRAHPDALRWEAAVCIAVAFAVGGYLGAWAVEYIEPKRLELTFGIPLFIAMRFIFRTDNDASTAAVGLAATVVALTIYAVLRTLGRRNLTPPPDLGKKIREVAAQESAGPDYYI